MNVKTCIDIHNYAEKPKEAIASIQQRLKKQEIDIEIFVTKVGAQGVAFRSYSNSGKDSDWECQQIFGIDIDNTNKPYLTEEAAIKRCKKILGIEPYFTYETFNCTKEIPKYRLVFVSNCPIEDKKIAKSLILGLLQVFPEADQSCKNLCRVFFGGKKIISKSKQLFDYKQMLGAIKDFGFDEKKYSKKYDSDILAPTSFDFKEIAINCKLLANMANGEHYNSYPTDCHHHFFHLSRNLYKNENYEEMLTRIVNKWPYTSKENKIKTYQSCVKYEYPSSKCNKKTCPYYGDCGAKNILKRYKNKIIINDSPNWLIKTENNKGEVTTTVNVGLLAQHIETTVEYKFVKKKGHEASFLYIYNEEKGVYDVASRADMIAKINEYIPTELQHPKYHNNVYDLLANSRGHLATLEDFDTNMDIINYENGIFYIPEMKMLPHDPKYLCSIQIKGSLLSKEEAYKKRTGVFDKYLDNLLDTETSRQTLLEFAGLTISNVPGNIAKKSLHQFGVGDAGKTQFKNFITYLIGVENTSSIELDILQKDIHASTSLYGCRLFGSNDASFNKAESFNLFKQIVGGDDITANPKGKSRFDFKPRCVVWTIGNSQLKFGGDQGNHVYDRIIYLESKNVVTNKDRLLFQKFIEEKEYIIYRCFEAFINLKNRDFNFVEDNDVLALRQTNKEMNNSLYKFLKEEFIFTTEDDYIKKGDFMELYQFWCEKLEGSYYCLKAHEVEAAINNDINKNYPQIRHRQMKVNNVNIGRVITGIRHNPEGNLYIEGYYDITTGEITVKKEKRKLGGGFNL